MAISGKQVINIGEPNESIGSDSLYTAFTKANTNFNQLFACASPYNTFNGNGVTITQNSATGNVTIDNAGVTSIIAGTGIAIDSSNGAVTITNTGGNGGGGSGVTSIGVTSSTLSVSNSPIVSSGNITLNLPSISPNPAGTFVYPSMTVDQYGRVTAIANGASVGTVTSVAVTPGTGIQVTGSPITTSGTINIVNTGVTRLSAGTGISLSGSNGAVTISTTPVVAELPVNISVAGNILSGSGVGYSAGAGGTVTQTTSRTTGVTINKISGAITLYSAAGTSSYTTFTVTNSTVAATDVIIINQKSGTDKYEAFVSNVASGSFNITFSDVSGTTSEQPVFNFAVIKAVAA